ncbi:MAG: T9SS C-terminal target domain-containing protein [Ignavibacteriae bacterium]|nr:MAG: T9SS C-terminal target domain-containing protein [Ignavibacteriota bacterium]
MKIIKPLFYVLLMSFIINSYAQDQKTQSNKHRGIDDFQFQLLPKTTDDPPYIVTRTDFTITLRDGVILDAVKFIPQATIPAGGWPTVIMHHGYGSDKEYLAGFCSAQAAYGYYTMSFSVRGQGLSGGLSNLISRTEATDLIEVVNWIKSDSVNGSDPDNILIMGGSQGGMLPYMAACMGQTSVGSLGVKTIISALAPPDFASSWIENGSIKMSLLWTVNYTPDIARYNSTVGRFAGWIIADTKEKWDSLAYWMPIDRDFMTLVPNNTTPLIMEGSWQDKFFNASGIIQATTLNTSPFRMYLGAVAGHGSDQSGTEDQWHMNFFNDWFFYWLYGYNNGTMDAPKYQYASTIHPAVNNHWTFVHDSSTVWPPANNSNLRLYFRTNQQLRTVPNTNPNSRINLQNKVTNGLTMTQAINEEFTGSFFKNRFKKVNLNFTTTALASDVKMVGVPKVNLQYSSSSPSSCQYNFQIYDVLPNGTQRLVNRINYTDRNNVANSVKTTLINGQAHSHIFKAGNKIKVTATNLDASFPEDTLLLQTNPFVLPVLVNSNNYINLNSNTYIDIPVVSTGLDAFTENVFSTTDPVEYKLNQNYPNPFNPATTIQYTIAKQDLVTLKIYDLLGREVKTLVNEFQEAGEHSVFFNASELASGIYFYKITSAGFQDVKRMVLLK